MPVFTNTLTFPDTDNVIGFLNETLAQNYT